MTAPILPEILLPFAIRWVPQAGMNAANIHGSAQTGTLYTLQAGTYSLAASYDGPSSVQLQLTNGSAPQTTISTVPSGAAGTPRRSSNVEITVTDIAKLRFAIVPPPTADDAARYRGSINVIPSQPAR